MSATFDLNGITGWTTTPEDRAGPGPPYTDPSLQVNLFFRVFLGFLSIFIAFVPARLLWWNGEFAATVFCITTIISSFFYAVNALIWRDDKIKTWYAGYGWCDVQVYIVFALETCYNICLFEIMRGLASKVALLRIGGLTTRERRRQHITSALVIFTIPFLQVVLTYFIIHRRYNVSTLAGCTAVYDHDWVFLVFFVLPSPIFILGAGIMAALAFNRYRRIEKTNSHVIHVRDNAQLYRQQRVRRKLYFLSFSVLIVVVPLTCFFFVANVLEGLPWTLPYDFNRIHYGPSPYNIHSVTFTTSDKMGFGDLTVNYIAILSAIAIFITFGTTTEAYNEYRKCLLVVGLGKIFPKLYQEYRPTPPSSAQRSWWSSLTSPLLSKDRTVTRLLTNYRSGSRKGSILPTAEHISLADQTHSSASNTAGCSLEIPGADNMPPPSRHAQASAAAEEAMATPAASASHHNPWPDLYDEEEAVPRRTSRHNRFSPNPWMMFRLAPGQSSTSTTMPIRLPGLPGINKKTQKGQRASEKQPDFGGREPAPSTSATNNQDHLDEKKRDADLTMTNTPRLGSIDLGDSIRWLGTSPQFQFPSSDPPTVDTLVWSSSALSHHHDDEQDRSNNGGADGHDLVLSPPSVASAGTTSTWLRGGGGEGRPAGRQNSSSPTLISLWTQSLERNDR
ncbi:pheromone A receptor-domain-containing protein [Apodospora peruviana]|uniref:Pheromone A receptor-domain-containing protein n=1 Tax=Apodospora peruviana TaxID=516989 RepID=A0AAE0IC15_9PEZI|nr:pheromone A receptor-domain-containing protein [Apodospora peruviana]